MKFFALVNTHLKITWRQKSVWFTVIPLTAFATLLAVTSPAHPTTKGVESLVFSAQLILIFTGIAYSAAFANFFTTSLKLGTQELEAAAPVGVLTVRSARIIGTFSVIIMPALVVLLIMSIIQTGSGNLLSIPAALAVTATIIAPGFLLAMSLSAFLGAILPNTVGRIVGVLIWFFLTFSSPLIPLPTPNGTVLSVVADPVATGYFGASPIYLPAGPLAFNDSAWTATFSLFIQFIIVILLLSTGSKLAEYRTKH